MGKKIKPMHVVFLLDESGSMTSLRTDVIGSYNGYVDKLRDDGVKKCRLTLATFNSLPGVKMVYKGTKLKDVPPLTTDDYAPRGGTPLLDAIGNVATDPKIFEDGEAVVFAIYTDGMENMSREYKKEDIVYLMKLKEKAGWTIVFMGADMDAFTVGAGLGIHMNTSSVSGQAVGQTIRTFAEATSQYASGTRGQSKDYLKP